jgi:hypothetical protein
VDNGISVLLQQSEDPFAKGIVEFGLNRGGDAKKVRTLLDYLNDTINSVDSSEDL